MHEANEGLQRLNINVHVKAAIQIESGTPANVALEGSKRLLWHENKNAIEIVRAF